MRWVARLIFNQTLRTGQKLLLFNAHNESINIIDIFRWGCTMYIHTVYVGGIMVQTRIFKSNKSQAVRLPKAVEMPENIKDVDIVAIGMTRIISPAGTAWDEWFENSSVSDDFMESRSQPDTQKRESF